MSFYCDEETDPFLFLQAQQIVWTWNFFNVEIHLEATHLPIA